VTAFSTVDALRPTHDDEPAVERLRRAVIAWTPREADLADSIRVGTATGGPLAGLPYALKDLFDVAGAPTRAGSSSGSAASRSRGATRWSLPGQASGAAWRAFQARGDSSRTITIEPTTEVLTIDLDKES